MTRIQVRIKRETKPQPPHGYSELETLTDWLQVEIEGPYDGEYYACYLEGQDQRLNVDCWGHSNGKAADMICGEFGIIADGGGAVFHAVEACYIKAFCEPQTTTEAK
jgi:hypothetical protein